MPFNFRWVRERRGHPLATGLNLSYKPSCGLSWVTCHRGGPLWHRSTQGLVRMSIPATQGPPEH
jgi:hypothetical protein